MYRYKVEVTRVVDGDTVDVDIDLGFGMIYKKQRVRMKGIDTPESRTRDLVEKKFGLMSKEFLKEHLKEAEKIVIKTHKGEETGKFGRILGEIFCDGENINKKMCDQGHAVAYYGQSKDDIQEEHLKNRKLFEDLGVV